VKLLLASATLLAVTTATYTYPPPAYLAPEHQRTSSPAQPPEGFKIGHFTLSQRPTGCTVVLAPPDAVGGVDVRGGAPGTIETDLLKPENAVPTVNAIFLTGGSAFGLATHDGVMKYLESQKIGFPFGGSYVPIVPGAVIFDLPVGDGRIRPDADCGFKAAAAATGGAVEEGSVGVGAGATVGKFTDGRPMKGGVGFASFTLPDGLIVSAIVVTNASGSIVDPVTAKAIAGVREADGKTIADPRALIRRGIVPSGSPIANTTLGVIMTNAKLTKAEATKVASMAHDGLARTIYPVHTGVDGDTIFAVSGGSVATDYSRVGVLAAEAVADAVLRSVRAAKGVPGYPSISDLAKIK
jgi:L-aminopeptidase/D-esterase-like protein